jgi:hypothetical protein
MVTLDTRYYDAETVLRIIAGDTLEQANSTIDVKDASGNGINLSGYDSGKLLIKRDLADDDSLALLSFDSTLGQLVLQNGSFYLVRAAADTKIAKGSFFFALKVKTGAVERTGVAGKCIIDPQGVE